MSQEYELTKKKCISCKEEQSPLKGQKLEHLYKELNDQWKIIEEHHLERTYSFPDFKTALAFTIKVGNLAEEEGHHPDILLSYGKVKITLWTHKINGLTENDFILAAKCEALKLKTVR